MTIDHDLAAQTWQDRTRPVADRVADLLGRMTVREKIAQLRGVWVGMDAAGGDVAPHQHDLADDPIDWSDVIKDGLGQLTRPFGTKPVDPAIGAAGLARTQREVVDANRFGIPALVHEECLTGLAAWRATVYPNPLCWGATFDPDLIRRMGRAIGATMAGLGVHQGLAPVLDVVRDLRWGRVEETIGEDPYLVGSIGSAYVAGIEDAGVIATLKHFLGYSASRAGRNLAPVAMGRRELADAILPPFEMAIRAGAGSVMNSYADVDGVPVAADPDLLTALLRDDLGFSGTVVADYFSIAFLQRLHSVAGTRGEAAALALAAGIDVELPTVDCYGEPLLELVESGALDPALVDRAAERVLRQKCELGLLDADWSPEPPVSRPVLDPDENRALAREIASRSIVLLANTGALPLPAGARLAVVGPRAGDPTAVLGCYSFLMHVGPNYPDVGIGIAIPSVLEALRGDPAGYQVSYAEGCPVLGGTDDDIAAAARLAGQAEVCVAVLGDRAGLFGRGTSGEGCDAHDLSLPGRQDELLRALLDTGTPVVLVLMVGRPYDLSPHVERLAAAVCAFFPGEEGAVAVSDVLAGRIDPSGRLPVSFPGGSANQPSTYLGAPLTRLSQVSSVDPSPLFPFGHGLSYSPVTWLGVEATSTTWPSDGAAELTVRLRNDADSVARDVVQVYLHDPVAEVARPVQQLVAAAAVELPAQSERTVKICLHADLTSYTGRDGTRRVDPGRVELRVGRSSEDLVQVLPFEVTGAARPAGRDRELFARVEVGD